VRPEATRVLDEAIVSLRENATLRVEIEGTRATWNGRIQLASAIVCERSRITWSAAALARWLRTVSYGEERPKYDNAREERGAEQRAAGC